MTKLAIVIPYYKPYFFKAALLSVKNQTNHQFHLYIGNDASPDDPRQTIQEVFGDDQNVTYIKFDNNLGSTNLVKQWERCIDMASQPYIWLFSDDDLMPGDAVARFYQFITQYPAAELIRFNLSIINDKGGLINKTAPHHLHETSLSFLKKRLAGQCTSAACEYIFTKDVYHKTGGIVDFPAGWAADDATWIKFGATQGIYTISGAPVLWRFGTLSVSSSTKNTAEKTKACLLFVSFVQNSFDVDKQLLLYWLYSQLAVLKYKTPAKAIFFMQLVKNKIFSAAEVLHFFAYQTIKKIIKAIAI